MNSDTRFSNSQLHLLQLENKNINLSDKDKKIYLNIQKWINISTTPNLSQEKVNFANSILNHEKRQNLEIFNLVQNDITIEKNIRRQNYFNFKQNFNHAVKFQKEQEKPTFQE